MADELGSYTVAFHTSGAILIVGASIVSLLKFTERPTKKQCVEKTDKEEEGELLVVEKVTVL